MEINDPRAIRALAHPLRLDLIDLLTTGGPATAAQCGRALGASQASCSFHLRQLGKYGFVEEAAPGPDRRERVWQIPRAQPELRITDGGPAGDLLRGRLERLVVERGLREVLAWIDRREDESAEWRAASDVVDAIAVLTVEQAAELKEQMWELIRPHLVSAGADARALRPGERAVRYFIAATPLPQADTAAELDDNGGTGK
ncbi:winged helix-turn-helix domain-containing protein [Streptacidiphilus rugosus]|uniref:winged helix-turn-helix domain-containing protein n=1 Tax=Streptacidiphilus rugosus TaxID=405783 RepID=UPI00068C0C0F|nr:helix-turn-helix domain-containing protein [Streptacidiphilus rugosus]